MPGAYGSPRLCTVTFVQLAARASAWWPGSSSAFAYAAMGGLVARVCGWCLVLAYGVSVAAVPFGRLADAASIGTLFAFALLNIAVIVRWRTCPDVKRTFRVPLAPPFPMAVFGFRVWMMSSPEAVTWVVFGGWTAVGLVIHFGYGQRRSRPETEGVDGVIEPVMESGQEK